MAHCTDAFGKSWNHMIRLMFRPFRLEYWVKGALLMFLAQGYQGPQPNLNGMITSTMNSGDPFSGLAENLPYIFASVIFYIFIGVLVTFIGAIVSFVFLNGAKEGVFRLRKSFQENLSGIISLFLWNIVAGIILFGAALIIAALIFGLVFLVRDAIGGAVITIIAVLASLVVGLVGFVFFVLYYYLLHTVVVPQMLVENKGIFEAWSSAISIFVENIMEFLGFMLIQLAIGLAFGMVTVIFYLFFTFFAMAVFAGVGSIENFPNAMNTIQGYGLMMPLGAFIAFFLLPVFVLLQSYTLNFLAMIVGNNDYYPVGCAPKTEPDESTSTTANTNSEPQPPSSPTTFNDSAPTQTPPPMNGPVNFSDIPPENNGRQPDAQPPQTEFGQQPTHSEQPGNQDHRPEDDEIKQV